MVEVDYTMFYKMPGIPKWKRFSFREDNDYKAMIYADYWAIQNNAERYRLEKVETKRVRLV